MLLINCVLAIAYHSGLGTIQMKGEYDRQVGEFASGYLFEKST
jgi:hypothetical protein